MVHRIWHRQEQPVGPRPGCCHRGGRGRRWARRRRNEEPGYGYTLTVFNEPTHFVGPRGFKLRTHADMNWEHAHNCVSLATSYGIAPDPDVVSFRVLKGAVLALGEVFGATSGKAWQAKLGKLWVSGRAAVELPIAWISDIGAPYAHLVTPPPTALVEHRPDGGLLMAATDEAFSIDHPVHMASAHDIAAAVAPFNALPRPLGRMVAPDKRAARELRSQTVGATS